MRPPRTPLACACLLAVAVLVVGCGGSEAKEGGRRKPPPERSTPAPPKSAFPATEGRTLRQMIKQAADHPAELKMEPQAMVFEAGLNRYPFGVFEKGKGSRVGSEALDAEVAIYYAQVPPTAGGRSEAGAEGAAVESSRQALDQPAVGPFPARIETLATNPEFESATTSRDPDAARVVYSAQVPMPVNGQWRLAALIKEGDEIGAITQLPSADAGEFDAVPGVGDRAPKIHTPTAQEANGGASKITTRVPPDTQNEVDYADVLGKEPILLLFATPKFCQSRVCSPVVDVAEQAKAKFGNEARFIHMEIYNDKNPDDLTVLPQVRAFHLPSEPWLFAIDREGVVRATVEGGFGTELMDETVEKAVGR
jgi:hypothetical protein